MSDKLKPGPVKMSRNVYSKTRTPKYNFDEEQLFDTPIASCESKDLSIEQNRLNNFLDIVISIGNELTDPDDQCEALKNILKYAQNITNADAGTIYQKTKVNQLDFMIINNRSLEISWNSLEEDEEQNFYSQPIKLYDPKTGQPNMCNIASVAYHSNQNIIVNDAYLDDQYDFSGTKEFDKKNNYHSKSFLTVPLRNRVNQVIGVFQLINATDFASNQVIPFKKNQFKMIEALASLAAICIRK